MLKAFLFALLLSFAPLPIAEAEDSPSLKVGLTGKYPPFNYFDERGTLTGFDVDVANHICLELHKKCEFVILQWDGILAALLAGKIDLIIGSMAITPEREESALFSVPYYESGAQIFSLHPNLDLEKDGVRIGVTLGTTYEAVVKKEFPNSNVSTYKGDPEILQDIKAGRIDAIVTDRLVGGYMIRRSGVELHPIGSPLFLERMGIPAQPGREALIQKVNEAISSLRASAKYDALAKKYFGIGISSERSAFSWAGAILLLLKGLLATIKVSAAGLFIGLLLSAGLATIMLTAPSAIRSAVRIATDFVRSTPFLIQLFAVYFGLPAIGFTISAFNAAVLTIAVHSSAYLAEVLVSGYRSIPPEQTHASRLLGLSSFQTLRFVIFPQMIPVVAAPSLNTIVAMIKDSAIVSVISVYELTMQTQQLISSTYRPFGFYLIAAALYALITYPLLIWGRRWVKRAHVRGTIHEE